MMADISSTTVCAEVAVLTDLCHRRPVQGLVVISFNVLISVTLMASLRFVLPPRVSRS